MSFVERSIILLCPYLGGSTIGGSTVYSSEVVVNIIIQSTVTFWENVKINSLDEYVQCTISM